MIMYVCTMCSSARGLGGFCYTNAINWFGDLDTAPEECPQCGSGLGVFRVDPSEPVAISTLCDIVRQQHGALTRLREERARLLAPAEGVDLEEVLRLDGEATAGPWQREGQSIRVDLPGPIEYRWASAAYPRDLALIVLYRSAAPTLAREVARLRARLVEVEGERDAARVDLAWHEQMNGTRAEQEAHDAEADAVDAAAEALTPEQIRAEMLEIGLDPDRVEREAEVSARLIVRWMQARDERDAARAEIEELRLTLAAEQGKPEGAPAGWKWTGDMWRRNGYPHAVTARHYGPTNLDQPWQWEVWDTRPAFDVQLLGKGYAATARAAMIAADKATT